MSNKVVVTGLGCVSSLGMNVPDFWASLCQGRSGIAPLVNIDEGVIIRLGATVKGYQPESYFSSSELPLLDRFSQFAVLAAREAIHDASLDDSGDYLAEAAAIIGTGCGGKQTDEETYTRLYKEGRSRAHPMTIPRGMLSAAASMVSMDLGIKGPVFSIASACASAAHAIYQGQMMILSGLADIALVGGTDAPFTYGLLKAWEALRVVSNDTCRPFSRDRTGMVLGEGAGMLVIETEEHATRRGARIYTELSGCGLSSDAGHITRPDVGGISLAIHRAIKNAGFKPESIDYINAHGTGTIANDMVETEALHRVFGNHAGKLAISSTKSMHGHALGASGAFEIIATTLAIYGSRVPPTANFTEPGEGCDLDYVPNVAREQKINVALSNSFAFGGLNAVLALQAWRG
jgi:nodulation protein E